ncbi:hypothetical protein GCM10010831_02450 [Psychroflexus salis]|uniref:Lysylphosphatidylglycerol synthase TM region n=1 Tax=Psychroflexus salis TaxID=1526574 RepID=A0A916ZM96_9FLAO|nr:hypothetical protein GCM10010831_02450 [Psychroflexus salis]
MFNFNKSKQNYRLLIKVLLVVISSGYIFHVIRQEQSSFYIVFEHFTAADKLYIFCFIALLLLFSILNWFFEILKWKTLVTQVFKITFQTAALQTLISHAVGVFTPNRVGDFAMKLSFFETKYRKRILGLNFSNNFIQMLITILFGGVGILILHQKIIKLVNFQYVEWFIGVFFFLVVFGLFFKKYLHKTYHSIKLNLQLNWNTFVKVAFFSSLRYFIFSHQYYLLGWFLGWDIAYLSAMPYIFLMYFVVSFLPSIFVLDAALKAGIGIYLFGFLGVSTYVILAISALMWLLNFALPALLGNFFMLRFNYRYTYHKPVTL